MKNIHILPTDKPSRLIINWEKDLCYKSKPYLMEGTQHIYITSDEEIKVNDYYYNSKTNKVSKKLTNNYQNHFDDMFLKKIILTTDQDLDGVQSIDDEFLEWFIKNPNCEFVEVKPLLSNNGRAFYGYKIIIPKEEPTMDFTGELDGLPTLSDVIKQKLYTKEEPKQETLEEAAERIYPVIETDDYKDWYDKNYDIRNSFIEGAKWQQERSYSEEEVKKLAFDFYYDMSHKMGVAENLISENATNVDVWFNEQLKKK